MKNHGRDCPDRCSICLGAAAQHVSPDGQTIDGVHTPRDIPADTSHQPRKRRGKR